MARPQATPPGHHLHQRARTVFPNLVCTGRVTRCAARQADNRLVCPAEAAPATAVSTAPASSLPPKGQGYGNRASSKQSFTACSRVAEGLLAVAGAAHRRQRPFLTMPKLAPPLETCRRRRRTEGTPTWQASVSPACHKSLPFYCTQIGEVAACHDRQDTSRTLSRGRGTTSAAAGGPLVQRCTSLSLSLQQYCSVHRHTLSKAISLLNMQWCRAPATVLACGQGQRAVRRP